MLSKGPRGDTEVYNRLSPERPSPEAPHRTTSDKRNDQSQLRHRGSTEEHQGASGEIKLEWRQEDGSKHDRLEGKEREGDNLGAGQMDFNTQLSGGHSKVTIKTAVSTARRTNKTQFGGGQKLMDLAG